ncbi:MAG: hypothetical protein FWG56_01435 [Desulfovibrionaceae bacterium]|jgi:hypothetical protein|nr:hypothetical protein [Desulfovibrionaceae bacterium]
MASLYYLVVPEDTVAQPASQITCCEYSAQCIFTVQWEKGEFPKIQAQHPVGLAGAIHALQPKNGS